MTKEEKIYIYIYICREREREDKRVWAGGGKGQGEVGWGQECGPGKESWVEGEEGQGRS